MLLRQMKYFLAVVECRSFSEAAAQCYISQSAISQQIKILEDELDVELIQRSNRRFQLTSAGEHFYKEAAKIIQQAEALKESVKQIELHERGLFRLGCLDGNHFVTICTLVNELLQEHSRLNIEIYWSGHEELLAKLKQHELDLIICDLRSQDELKELEQLPLSEEPLYVAISTRSSLTELSYVNCDQLQSLHCVITTSTSSKANDTAYYAKLLNFDGEYFYPPRFFYRNFLYYQ